MLAKRAVLRMEFDRLSWRVDRLNIRRDALAKDIEDLTIEIAVAGVIQKAADSIEAMPTFMEFMEKEDGRKEGVFKEQRQVAGV